MERPYCFSVGDVRFYIYPISLGKRLLIKRLIDSLELKSDNLQINASAEVLRVVGAHLGTCLRIIAYTTCKTKEEVFDEAYIQHNISILQDGMTDEDIVTLMLAILTGDKTDEVMKALKIDKEIAMMRSVARAKKDSGTLSFGGKSLFGSTIDVLCARYGWTLEYVVWGISYTAIRLLLADYVKDIHLTEDERNHIPANVLQKDEDVIEATKDNMDMIRSMDWR